MREVEHSDEIDEARGTSVVLDASCILDVSGGLSILTSTIL